MLHVIVSQTTFLTLYEYIEAMIEGKKLLMGKMGPAPYYERHT